MKNTLTIGLLSMIAVALAGCSQSTPQAPSADPLTAAHAEFVTQFAGCEQDLSACDLNRDQTIQGTITRVYGTDLVDISTDQGTTMSAIPLLPDTQQKRQTILVDQSGNAITMDDIAEGDQILAQVKSFDRIENGQLTEKLGQFGYIQITKQ